MARVLKRISGTKFSFAKKKTKTKHWLRILAIATPELKEDMRKLWKEYQELTLIFGKIVSSLNKN